MKIILDGMGGDHGPVELIQGAIDSLQCDNHDIVIIGDENKINVELKKHNYDTSRISVLHATEEIQTSEAPVKAVRTKKQSSIVLGLNMVKNKEADIFVSAGSTGALLAGGLFILGRIQGIDRPAIATIYPVMGKEPSLLLDIGANTECRPNNLFEFATMGSIYMEKVLGRENPTVGLLNNGAEENKGNTLTKATHELLKKSTLNFIGNVEARDLPTGSADVITTDGFTGNAVLKVTEGMGLMFIQELKSIFTTGVKEKIGALLIKNQLVGIKKAMDYSEYGGAPILGVKGGIIKMHGSSKANAVKNGILKAIPYVRENVIDIIQNSVISIEEIELDE